MSLRNLSPQRMFEDLALAHEPVFRFNGSTKADVDAWKAAALPQVMATLGDFPARCQDLDPQQLVVWEHDGLRKEKWIIDVQPGLSATLLLNVPPGLAEGERRPAILCWHGHGPFGKEPVMGNTSSPELRRNVADHNYNYGHQMAKAGFVTYAIDWIGCGERNETRKPQHRADPGHRDWCNLYYLHATMLGMTSIGINASHGMAATDFAVALPFVDPDKLGVMGLSGGGTATLWTAHCDARMKAAEIICYSDLWAHFGFCDINYCGMQVAPGLFKLVDLPDLQGLLAPRPLLIDIGVYDTCFDVETALTCFRRLEEIYTAAGAREQLDLDLHPNEHSWGGNRSVAFFEKHLGSVRSAGNSA